MARSQSIFFSLNDKTAGNRYDSEYLIRRLKCEHVFVGHEGCVNTVSWNDNGDVLLTGSDDCKLNFYKLSSMKPIQSISSGHRANIFSAKFLPCTADSKVASCSGDGILHYNDINSHLSYGKNSFRCHTGTTYEVNTTPGDPHSFMSSGEDGTVRLFDLRSKTKCSCEGCKEDILIECKKAVTSFSVNPVQPYQVAIGCENSLLRVYDRRSLTTGDQGNGPEKERGLLYQFKPKALEKRECRVTSLKYSLDGQNLLASYCSDYVYLLDSNPKTSVLSQSCSQTEVDALCPNEGPDPPMKRLRLRGDWSDTGPNARPDGENSVSTENNYVQRLSGYLTRWIEHSIRDAQRYRRQNPSTPRRHPENVPERNEHSTSTSRRRSDNEPERSADGTSNTETGEERESLGEENLEQQRTPSGSVNDVICDNNDVIRNDDDITNNCSGDTGSSRGVVGNDNHNTENDVSYDYTGSCNQMTSFERVSGNHVDEIGSHSNKNIHRKIDNDTCEGTKIEPEGLETNIWNKTPENCSPQPFNNRTLTPDRTLDPMTQNVANYKEPYRDNANVLDEVAESSSRRKTPSETDSSNLREATISGICTPGINSLGTESQGTEGRIMETDTDTASSELAPEIREDDIGECSKSDDNEPRREAAAQTIQKFFRFRFKKDFKSISSDVPVHSDVKQVFKGHRNARTMIKEANFWGDDYVLSGSDCGRIFIWSRKTAEVVMLLDGDRHVVNCVQPHPYVPMLATSGIDYDVKLWTPTALDVCRLENAKEVVARNERMLRESRDTLTVPASFMIRVLSSLHRVGFREEGETDTDSDMDED